MLDQIDLIPTQFRRARSLRAWLNQMSLMAAAAVLLTLLAYSALSWWSGKVMAEKLQLEQQLAVTNQQRNDLEVLLARKTSLQGQLTLLSSLRSGSPVQTVFTTIDQALTDADIWFTDWQFRRAGVMVPEAQARGVETGYFIVVPESAQTGKEQAWLVETHMTISGQARDHEALSRFVNGLYAQPAVVQVSVQGTELARRANRDVVKFELAIVLNSEAQG